MDTLIRGEAISPHARPDNALGYDISFKSVSQVGHATPGFVTPQQAADHLNVAKKTILRWCESGKIPAFQKPYGKRQTYLIPLQALQSVRQDISLPKPTKSKHINTIRSHWEHITGWKQAMENGLMTGRPFSPHTVNFYSFYAEQFLEKYGEISVRNLKNEFLDTPKEQFGRKDKLFRGIISFAKYLIEEQELDSEFLEQAKKLKPKRFLPPKRHVVNEEEIQRVLAVCEIPQEIALITLLVSTGLRATECCSLSLDDIDFEKRFLTVRLGKGNKTRRVGLNLSAIDALSNHLKTRVKVKHNYIFIDKNGQPLDRHGLNKRLQKLGKLAGVKLSPHCLRRAFVTINANKGRPLQMLQMACGHVDIKTTRDYCQTSELEMLRAMQIWD